MTAIEFGVRLLGVRASKKTIWQDTAKRHLYLELEADRPAQEKAFRTFQRSAVRALRELLFRSPGRGPSVCVNAWLGDEKQPYKSSALEIRFSGRKRLFCSEKGREACATKEAGLTKASALLRSETELWFRLFVDDQGALERYYSLLFQKQRELLKAAEPASLLPLWPPVLN